MQVPSDDDETDDLEPVRRVSTPRILSTSTSACGLHEQPKALYSEDFDDMPISVRVGDIEIHNYWAPMPNVRRWAVETIIDELNLLIPMWIAHNHHSDAGLQSDRDIMLRFSMLRCLGKAMEIPDVLWDVNNNPGLAKCGHAIYRYARAPSRENSR